MFKVIIVLISLFIASANAADSSKTPKELDVDIKGAMPLPDFLDDGLLYTAMTFGWRNSQFMRFRLKKDEKQLHKSAIYFMLENAQNGKIVSWYSKNRLANGKVRVIHSYPVSGGYCRSYQSYIKIHNKEKHMTILLVKKIGCPGGVSTNNPVSFINIRINKFVNKGIYTHGNSTTQTRKT